MAKYTVIKRFRLLDDQKVEKVGPIYEAGEIIDIQVKRAADVVKNIGDSFLERVEANKEPESVDNVVPVGGSDDLETSGNDEGDE